MADNHVPVYTARMIIYKGYNLSCFRVYEPITTCVEQGSISVVVGLFHTVISRSSTARLAGNFLSFWTETETEK